MTNYKIDSDDLTHIKHFAEMFNYNAELIEGLCKTDRADINIGFEAGVIYNNLKQKYAQCLEFIQKIQSNEYRSESKFETETPRVSENIYEEQSIPCDTSLPIGLYDLILKDGSESVRAIIYKKDDIKYVYFFEGNKVFLYDDIKNNIVKNENIYVDFDLLINKPTFKFLLFAEDGMYNVILDKKFPLKYIKYFNENNSIVVYCLEQKTIIQDYTNINGFSKNVNEQYYINNSNDLPKIRNGLYRVIRGNNDGVIDSEIIMRGGVLPFEKTSFLIFKNDIEDLESAHVVVNDDIVIKGIYKISWDSDDIFMNYLFFEDKGVLKFFNVDNSCIEEYSIHKKGVNKRVYVEKDSEYLLNFWKSNNVEFYNGEDGFYSFVYDELFEVIYFRCGYCLYDTKDETLVDIEDINLDNITYKRIYDYKFYTKSNIDDYSILENPVYYIYMEHGHVEIYDNSNKDINRCIKNDDYIYVFETCLYKY